MLCGWPIFRRDDGEDEMTGKPTKTREELAATILLLMKASPECPAVSGVVIAPVLKLEAGYANWRAAFTMRGKESVPRTTRQIGSKIADEFDFGVRRAP
jgi:hypothetical protein